MRREIGSTLVVLVASWGFLCMENPARGTTALTSEDIEGFRRAQVEQRAGRYEEAATTYLRIMREYPLSQEAFESGVHLAVLHAASGSFAKATESLRAVVQAFGPDLRLDEAFKLIAYDSMRSPHHQEALRFCKSAVRVCPADVKSVWVQTALVISKGGSNEPNEQEAVTVLLNDYADDPQVTEAISLAAWNYRVLGEPVKARDLYRHVVNTWPTAEQALYAHRGIVRTYTACKDMPGADMAVAELIDNFYGDSRLAGVASDLAGEFREKGQRDRARMLYQHIVDNHPTSPEAITAQVRAVQLNIELGDSQTAAGGFGNLVTRWPNAAKLPQMIVWIADSYRKAGQWQNAELLCQQVVSQYGNDRYAILAQAIGWGCSDVLFLSDPNATGAMDGLFAAHPDDPMVPKAAYIAAEVLRDRAAACGRQGQAELRQQLHRTTARVCEKVFTQGPDTPYAARAMILMGDCFRQLGEPSKAIACYRRASEQWPEHELAWSALLKLARVYEDSPNPAKASTRATVRSCYVQIVNRYPECPVAAYARHWLSKNSD